MFVIVFFSESARTVAAVVIVVATTATPHHLPQYFSTLLSVTVVIVATARIWRLAEQQHSHSLPLQAALSLVDGSHKGRRLAGLLLTVIQKQLNTHCPPPPTPQALAVGEFSEFPTRFFPPLPSLHKLRVECTFFLYCVWGRILFSLHRFLQRFSLRELFPGWHFRVSRKKKHSSERFFLPLDVVILCGTVFQNSKQEVSTFVACSRRHQNTHNSVVFRKGYFSSSLTGAKKPRGANLTAATTKHDRR